MTFLLNLLTWHYSQLQTSASLMAFSQSAVSWPLFPVFNFAVINISFYTIPPYIPSRYSHLIYTFPLSTSFLLCLTAVRQQSGFLPVSFFFSFFFYGDRLSDCRPTPNLEGQSTAFINPGVRWSSYPQATRTHFSRLLRPIWTAVGQFFSTVTRRGFYDIYSNNIK